MKLFYFLPILTLFAVGCSGGSGSPAAAPDSSEEFKIQGMPPEKYFEQLVYRCPDVSNPKEDECLVNSTVIKINKAYYGHQTARVEIDLFLLEDRTFKLEYSEKMEVEPDGLSREIVTMFNKSYIGKWQVKGPYLYIGDLGYLSSLIYNNLPASNLVLNNDVSLPGVAAKSPTLRRHWTNGKPE